MTFEVGDESMFSLSFCSAEEGFGVKKEEIYCDWRSTVMQMDQNSGCPASLFCSSISIVVIVIALKFCLGGDHL